MVKKFNSLVLFGAIAFAEDEPSISFMEYHNKIIGGQYYTNFVFTLVNLYRLIDLGIGIF